MFPAIPRLALVSTIASFIDYCSHLPDSSVLTLNITKTKVAIIIVIIIVIIIIIIIIIIIMANTHAIFLSLTVM